MFQAFLVCCVLCGLMAFIAFRMANKGFGQNDDSVWTQAAKKNKKRFKQHPQDPEE